MIIKDKNFQKRHFILSSFARSNIKFTAKVYEFVDCLIDNDYQFPLHDLNAVDKEISNLYYEYSK